MSDLLLQIIILNYNTAVDAADLYDLIRDFGIGEVELLVIDNASNRENRGILENRIPKKDLILKKKNLGYAEGNRTGIEAAKKNGAEFILLLNPDIRLEENSILALLKQIKRDESIAAIGPRIYYRDRTNIIYSDGGLVFKEKGFYANHMNYRQNAEEIKNPGLHSVDYVNGSCFLFRASAYGNIGPMRKDFFLYYEETEWCLRAAKMGYKCLIDSNVTAYHSSSKKNSKYHYYMTRNRILLAKVQKEYIGATFKAVIKKVLLEIYFNIKDLKIPSIHSFSKLKGIAAASLYRI